jgi:hypothetical protein
MFTVLMLTPTRRLSPVLAAVALMAAAASCEKVPLLAPSGSSITLTTASSVLSANGTTQIIAQVIEASGTPPHSGTHITFTTSLGTVQPSDAETDINGRAIVTFSAGSNNGVAMITASSGGATTGTSGALRIAIGTAAVGRISLSANPSTISSNGGSSTILASVVDVNGNALTGVPVSFSTTAGALASGLVNTDANGNAQTTLTTSVQADVTATAGVQGNTGSGSSGGGSSSSSAAPPAASTAQSATVRVNVNPVPTVSVSTTTSNITANVPIVFNISVTPGQNSSAQIRNVQVSFGDGDVADL